MSVGQTVYVNVHGSNNSSKLRKGHIAKIGRKYIYVQIENRTDSIQFCKNTLRENKDWGYKSVLYFSEQDYYDSVEFNKNMSKLENYFMWYNRPNITLDQTRRILNIIQEQEDGENG